MNLMKILVGICSLMFFMIGADKFFSFLQPPCSLQDSIPSSVWMILGVLQLAAGILIWLPKFRKGVAGFFFIFMLVFTVVHFTQGTTDVGGAAFMATLLGVITLNPTFLRPKKVTSNS